jgi:hypothetical protein
MFPCRPSWPQPAVPPTALPGKPVRLHTLSTRPIVVATRPLALITVWLILVAIRARGALRAGATRDEGRPQSDAAAQTATDAGQVFVGKNVSLPLSKEQPRAFRQVDRARYEAELARRRFRRVDPRRSKRSGTRRCGRARRRSRTTTGSGTCFTFS